MALLLLNMQQPFKQFRVTADYTPIYVSLYESHLKIIMLVQAVGAVYQQLYDQKTLPSSNKYQFKSCQELYFELEKYSSSCSSWSVREKNIVVQCQKDNVLQLSLVKVVDTNVICALLLKEIWQVRQESWSYVKPVIEEVQQLKTVQEKRHKDITQSLEAVETNIADLQNKCAKIDPMRQQFQSLKEANKQLRNEITSELNRLQRHDDQLSGQVSKLKRLLEQQSKQLHSQIEELDKINQKNWETQKEEFAELSQQTKNKIKEVSNYLEKNDIEKLKKDVLIVNEAFDNEIRLKNYEFLPDQRCLENSKAVYFLNKKTLKCIEEVKDYAKVIGSLPFPKGRFSLRVFVKSIKNNGFMMGVCTKNIKDTIHLASFNDSNITSINSCGYAFNRGLMSTFSGRIRSGTMVKMIVSLPLGEVRWFANDMELFVVNLGQTDKEDIFPLIGLGNMCDQVDLVVSDGLEIVQQNNESYNRELIKLNRTFARQPLKP